MDSKCPRHWAAKQARQEFNLYIYKHSLPTMNALDRLGDLCGIKFIYVQTLVLNE